MRANSIKKAALEAPSLAPANGLAIRFVSKGPPMITIDGLAPGIVATIFGIGMGPMGVVAVNRSSLTVTSALRSSPMMNALQRARASEPEGLGPNATICRGRQRRAHRRRGRGKLRRPCWDVIEGRR